MKVEVKDAGKAEKRIEVHCAAEDVKEAWDRYFKMYRAQVRVPGFRPGKAPEERIRKMYGAEILKAAKEELRDKGLRQAIRDNVLEVVGENDLEETGGETENSAYDLALTVQVAPKFTVPDYKGLEVEARAVEVTDEEVEKEVEAQREERGSLADAEEGAEAKVGDLVQIDYEGTVDGKPVSETAAEAKDLDKRENFWVATNPEFSFLPGFGEQLAGMKVGDKKTIEIDFGADAKIAGLAGKKGSFEVVLKKIRTRKPAALDEAFFKAFGVKDEAEFRAAARAEIEHAKRHEEEHRREDALLEALVARAGEFEISEKQLKRHELETVYRTVRRLAARRVPEESIRQALPQLEEQAKKQAPRELAQKYLLRAVFDAEECVVPKDLFQSRLRQMMDYSGVNTINELASKSDRDAESVRKEIYDSFVTEWAIRALAARANWTGAEAEKASNAAKRLYRMAAVRSAQGDKEWEEWSGL